MAPRSLLLLAIVLVGSTSGFAQSPPVPADSLYARLGGETKVAAFVSQALDHANRADAKQMLADQICALSGGGCAAGGDALGTGHHVNDTEFRALVEELRVAMRAQNVPLAARNELLELLAPINRDVARL